MPTHGSTHGPITPHCPRCGYDQSGEVTTWTDRCPTQGTCPECGTRFDWADLFVPSRQDIHWLVEHASSLRSMLRRSVPTLVRMSLPWVFWARVGIPARTAPRRLALWVVLLGLTIHLIAWLPFSVMFGALDAMSGLRPEDIADYLRTTSKRGFVFVLAHGLAWPAFSMLDRTISWDGYYAAPELWRVIRLHLGIGLAWYGVLSLLPVTRRMAQLRQAHLLRALLLHAAVVVIAFEIARFIFPLNMVRGGFWPALLLLLVYAGAWFWSLTWWGTALRVGWGVRSLTLLVLGSVAAVLGGLVLMTIEDSISFMLR